MIASLQDGTIDVRAVLSAEAGEAEYAALRCRLYAEEQALAARFLHLRDRLAFAIGRVLARTMLSDHAAEPDGGWRFERNRYGKPSIVRDTNTPDLRFNISHCAGAVVVAVAYACEVGVDVESLEPRTGGAKLDDLAAAQENFTAPEVALLEAFPTEERHQAFLSLWTLKEAFLKARGTGLAEPLAHGSFQLEPPFLVSTSSGEHPADRWFFAQQEILASHILAMAAERRPGVSIDYRLRQMELAELLG